MKVRNKTRYFTADLRRLIGAVASIELEPSKKRWLRVDVLQDRGSRHWVRGYAAFNSQAITIKVSGKSAPDPVAFAYVVAHELAHAFKGMRHRDMRGTRYKLPWEEMRRIYGWAAGYTIRVKPEPAKRPKPGAPEKLEHAQEMVRRWESKIRRGGTFLKGWKRRVRYYDRLIEKAATKVKGE